MGMETATRLLAWEPPVSRIATKVCSATSSVTDASATPSVGRSSVSKVKDGAVKLMWRAMSATERSVSWGSGSLMLKLPAISASSSGVNDTRSTVVVLCPDRGDRYLSTEVFRSVCALCPP